MAARQYLFALSALLLGCFDPGEGIEPPAEKVYFPVGLAVDDTGSFLYIANSDFDLQYNAGTLQSWDLAALRERLPRNCKADADCLDGTFCDLEPTAENGGIPGNSCVAADGPTFGEPCGVFGEREPREKLLYPGRCGNIHPAAPQDGGSPILSDDVQIGAFATDVIYRRRPDGVPGEGRVFVPVRGDATLHWADVDNGGLECGQGGNDGACDDLHRAGDDPDLENTRDLRLLPEPFALDATEDAREIMVTNQTSGAVSLFMHDWQEGPRLEFAVTGLPTRPVGIASVPAPLHAGAAGLLNHPGFLVTFRDSANVILVRVYDDASSDPIRPYARAVSSTSIAANSVGIDSRGIAIDSSVRKAAESECATLYAVTPECVADVACLAETPPEYKECLENAAAIPLDLFVSNRAPASLLVGQSRSVFNAAWTDDLPAFNTSVPLSLGPSRVVVGEVTNPDGELERRVFVVCFDSRRVFIYDPVRHRMEAEVITGRGPHALALDAAHGLAYVGHFTDSFVGVISLDQRFPDTYATIVATVEAPQAPRASK
ncbi:MAG TPA: hypothetical protein VM686_15700 [Polyangiaceae bacterium]|nr:hypothetical protein [Polyangiaceae bacterium]